MFVNIRSLLNDSIFALLLWQLSNFFNILKINVIIINKVRDEQLKVSRLRHFIFMEGCVMKAAVFKNSGLPLSIEQLEDPIPAPTDMVIKVCACGICGTDLHWSEINNEESGFRDIHPGAVMGHEFSGEIVEIGRNVKQDWKIGERVCAMPQIGCANCSDCIAGRPHRCSLALNRATPGNPGAYSEFIRIGAKETFRLPDSVTFQEGALVEPLAVGLHAVKRAQVTAGDDVLIVGGLSLIHI